MANNNIPLAILGAGALLAAGLFFGLRGRTTETSQPQASSAQTPTAQSAPTQPVAVPPSTAPAASVLDKINADVEKALTAEKAKTFVSTCWKPLLAKTPKPARAKYTFDMAFDSQGKEIARSISEHREAERADVGVCLRKLPMALTIPAPGVSVPSVKVEIEFP